MAQNWEELGKTFLPDEEFENAGALYRRTARLVIDQAFTVSVDVPPGGGFISGQLADLFGDADVTAVEAAKAHMAETLAAAAMAEDTRTGTGMALHDLLEEQDNH